MSLVIRGGDVLLDGAFVRADVTIAGGTIANILPSGGPASWDGAAVIDATGLAVLPGFVDVQVNGGWGIDITSEPHRIAELSRLLVRQGVTAFCPTVISSSPGRTAAAVAAAQSVDHAPGSARMLGLHLEGPCLSPERRGAHELRHLRAPSLAESAAWRRETGVSLVTLAPELPGASAVITALQQHGVAVAAGHTRATAAELNHAADLGLTGVTHLFNGMDPIDHRRPGVVGAALTHPHLIASLIVDGVHVDPIVVSIAWRALGPARFALVTDATAAAGLTAGIHCLGDVEIVADGSSVRTTDGTLAGSVLRMDQALANLMAFTGCSLSEAATAASATPAQLIGRADLGRLNVGGPADVVLLDADGRVAFTIVDGVVGYDAANAHARAVV